MLGRFGFLGSVMLLVHVIAAKRPNFVVLFLDDHGWGDTGLNDRSVTETPHMDALAKDGVRFTDWHAGFSVCTASRAALLTGRTCPRTGVCGNFGPESKYGIPETEVTIAELLQRGGYDTHMIGKWHLGHNSPHSPSYRGFRSWFGLPYSGDMGCIDANPQGCRPEYNRSVGQPACPMLCAPESSCRSDVVGIPLYNSTGPNCSNHSSCNQDILLQPFDPLSLNSQYAARAAQVLAQPSSSPFFLYVAFAHTHTPLAYDEVKFGNSSHRPGRAKVFGNTLAEVDHAVGRIVAAVDAAGLGNNTLILLTSDNGPADLGSVACEAVGSQGPFTGEWQRSPRGGGGGGTGKTTVWEGGHRMVGMARWRGVTKPGSTSNHLVSSLDVTPTLAAAAGVPLPADRVYDGVDLGPILKGIPGALGHNVLVHPQADGKFGPDGVPAIRVGKYKAFYKTSGSQPCRNPDGTHRDDGGKVLYHEPPLVFDLDLDPSESTPLSPGSIRGIMRRIQEEYTAYWESVNHTMRSTADYTSGGRVYAPCGNVPSPVCRTKRKL